MQVEPLLLALNERRRTDAPYAPALTGPGAASDGAVLMRRRRA